MDDFSLRFSGTCLKFCLFLRLASRYVLRSHSSTWVGLGGGVGTVPLGEKNWEPQSRFPDAQEMVNSLWSTTALLNRQHTVPSLNNSITHSTLSINIFSSSKCIDMTWWIANGKLPSIKPILACIAVGNKYTDNISLGLNEHAHWRQHGSLVFPNIQDTQVSHSIFSLMHFTAVEGNSHTC